MIKSMTAYADSSHTENCIRCDVEIRSYNSKSLDIALYMPRMYSRYEDGIKKLVSARLARGRIEIRIGIEDHSDNIVQFHVDMPRAQAYCKALLQLKEQLTGLFSSESSVFADTGITLQQILDGKDMIQSAENSHGDDFNLWNTIVVAVDTALENLESMRANEGKNLAADLLERVVYIEDVIQKIEIEAVSMPGIYRERLVERVSVLMQDIYGNRDIQNIKQNIDPVRLAQEVAILADKSDISEEITRIRSHIGLFRGIVASPEPGGRKLNFLIQELNREFNTIGSKCGKAELAHMIVDLKSELEKIREQIQNIE